MKKLSFHQWALVFALLMLVITLALVITGNGNNAGPFLIAFFISLSFGVKSFQATKGLSFTMWMFTAVAAAMYFPQYFVSYGDFQFKRLITPLLQIIMFGMGAQMSLNDFTGVIKMPKGVAIGVIGHYTIMPVMAFLITAVFDFPPEIAAGIILAGCVPSGLASNVMSLLANANLALAVTIGATTTILAPFVTPFLMKIIGGQFIAIDVWKMMLDIFEMMILPIIAGFIFNLFNIGKADRRSKTIQMLSYFIIILLANIIYMKVHNTDFAGYLKESAVSLSIFFILPVITALALKQLLKGDQKVIKKVLSMLSMVGIAIIVIVITAAGRDSLMKVGGLLLILVILHNLAGYALGYGVAWAFKMPEQDRRTIAFEVGMPNAGLASGLAMTIGNIATVGLAPAVYGPLMNVTGSTLASWWRTKIPKDAKTETEMK
ncbi:MAG TPA: bile acid:sodium symporter family protein [Bacteroidales bacterium]|nr:bile acid:sodium symporter family protein [Bacteroidales bacterium]